MTCKNVLKTRWQKICISKEKNQTPSWANHGQIRLLFWVPIIVHHQANHWIFVNAVARCTMSPCCVKLTEQMDRDRSIVLLSWGHNWCCHDYSPKTIVSLIPLFLQTHYCQIDWAHATSVEMPLYLLWVFQDQLSVCAGVHVCVCRSAFWALPIIWEAVSHQWLMCQSVTVKDLPYGASAPPLPHTYTQTHTHMHTLKPMGGLEQSR